MSRSRKFPCFSDNRANYGQKLHHRRVRAEVRNLFTFLEVDNWPPNRDHVLQDPYNICDWYYHAYDDPKAYRK